MGTKRYIVAFGYQDKMLYNYVESFANKARAKRFASANAPATLIKLLPATKKDMGEAKDSNKPFAIVAEFHGKFKFYGLGGSYEKEFTTYDVIKCTKEELDSLVEELAQKQFFKRVQIGVEISFY